MLLLLVGFVGATCCRVLSFSVAAGGEDGRELPLTPLLFFTFAASRLFCCLADSLAVMLDVVATLLLPPTSSLCGSAGVGEMEEAVGAGVGFRLPPAVAVPALLGRREEAEPSAPILCVTAWW